MKRFTEVVNEAKAFTYEYGCLMLGLDVTDWKKEIRTIIKKEDLYDVKGYGFEDHPHVTIFYGILGSVHPDVVKEAVSKMNLRPPSFVSLRDITIFENDEYDVVKFDIDDKFGYFSSLHYYIKDELPNETEFDEYHPHCTIAYVKKGRGMAYIQSLSRAIIATPTKLYYSYPTKSGKRTRNADIVTY